MQQLADGNEPPTVEECAADVVGVGLAVSRLVRAQLTRKTQGGATLPQIRALAFINADPACAPSQLAEYLMLSRPAVTRLLDSLGERGWITREAHPDDRRRLQLAVTAPGRARLESYFAAARAIVADRLSRLSPGERALVRRAMQLVLPLVGGATVPGAGGGAE
jgi:DNA-binding MarR family transcriptional regulator